jgi:hypothetical protein
MSASDALATELREPKAHMVVDVPNDWKVGVEGDYALAYPGDNSFHLRIVSSDHGLAGEADAEKYLNDFLAKHLTNVTVDKHARKVDFNNYVGFEIFGTGKEHDGSAAKFFALILTDKTDAKAGVVALGTGTVAGFQKHADGIREALRTLRATPTQTECKTLASSTCEGSRTFATHCSEYEANLKPRMAYVAAQCLAHAPSCEGTPLIHCAAEAIRSAAPDPTAEGFCKPLVATCTKESVARLPLGDCINYASGLSDRGRAAFATCVKEGAASCSPNPRACLNVYF